MDEAAASETRWRTAAATSPGSTTTPAGVVAVMASRAARCAALPGVSVTPGATVVNRTPRGPCSAAQLRVSCASAAFVAVCIAPNGEPTLAIQEPTVTTAPLPRAAMAGAGAPTRTCGARTAFPRSRRDRLTPAQAGVQAFPGPRRVPGLRREELSLLAGVSPDDHSRLEQGRQANVSLEVLDALSRALRLDAVESAHLRDLAAPTSRRRTVPDRDQRPDRGC